MLQFTTDGIPFHLDDDDADELGTAAACSSHIERFHLDVSGMTSGGCSTLVPFLETSPKLQSVKLEGNLDTARRQRATGQVTNLLLDAVGKNNSLQTLKLTGTHFGSATVQRLLRNSHFRNLVLVDCWRGATPQMTKQLAKAVAENVFLRDMALAGLSEPLLKALLESLKDHTSIHKLHLGTLRSVEASHSLREVLDSNIQLTDLDICGAEITAETLQPVVDGIISSETIRSLSLSHCRLDGTAVNCLKQLFRSSNTTLQHINLSESIPSASVLGELLKCLHRNTSITLLDLANCDFDTAAAAPHIKALLRRNRTLKRLDIDRNTLTLSSVAAITEGLHHNTKLEYLDCSGCDLDDRSCMRILDASRNLTHLIMCGNNLGLTTARHFYETNMGQSREKLLHLVLNGCELGDEAAEQLGKLLKTGNAVLKALTVDHCNLTGRGFAKLMEGVQLNASLRNLSADCITLAEPEDSSQDFCQAIVDFVPDCGLESLSFTVSEARSSRPTRQQQEEVLQAFDRNMTLIEITVGGWLLSAAQRKKYIAYYVIRNQVMPFVNTEDETETGINDSTNSVAAVPPVNATSTESSSNKRKKTEDDKSKSNFPRGLWPRLMGKLLSSRDDTAGVSAAFLALSSRPDLILTDETAPSPCKKRRQS